MKKIIYKIFAIFPFVKSAYEKLMKRRYRYLYQIIENKKCKRIMEIGTFDGQHALKMINIAKKMYGHEVEYYGFDLFEGMRDEIFQKEAAKHPISEEQTRQLLYGTGCKINLFKGFTNETLPRFVKGLPKMDLIFIDGGHSLETIANDWHYSQELMHDGTVVIFDDYWNCNDVGCKTIVEGIDPRQYVVEILPIQDKFIHRQGLLRINFVMVTPRKNFNEK